MLFWNLLFENGGVEVWLSPIPCLNPCCFGTYFLRTMALVAAFEKSLQVLILVVLELTFWVEKEIRIIRVSPELVLILVVLELTFWEADMKVPWSSSAQSLNPCCFGTYFLRKAIVYKTWDETCLNPCCFGTYFLSE